MNKRLNKILILCGTIGPVYFALSILILGSMFPGYNHMHDFISELGAIGSPVMDITNYFSFFAIGIFLFLYSIGIIRAYQGHKIGMIAGILLLIAGSIIPAIGLFPCDPACINVSETGKLHNLSATVPFFFVWAALVLIAIEAWKGIIFNKKWAIVIILLTISSVSFGIAFSEFETGYGGLLQRLAYSSALLFMLLSSIHLYRHEFKKGKT